MKKILLVITALFMVTACADDDNNTTTNSEPNKPHIPEIKNDTLGNVFTQYLQMQLPATSIDNKRVIYNFEKININGQENQMLTLSAKGPLLDKLPLPPAITGFFQQTDVISFKEFEEFKNKIKPVFKKYSGNIIDGCGVMVGDNMTVLPPIPNIPVIPPQQNVKLYGCEFQAQDDTGRNIITVIAHKLDKKIPEITHIVIQNEFEPGRTKEQKLVPIFQPEK